MKDQESFETLVARLPVKFIVESEDNSTDLLAADLTGLNLEDPPAVSEPAVDQPLQPLGVSVRSKRRLATTRGFDNSGLVNPSSQKLVTPSNTPSKFLPTAGSTPLTPRRTLGDRLLGISAIQRGAQLPPPPNRSSARLPPLPPRRSPLPPPIPAYPKPVTSIRVSVITPSVTPEQSLDWDNYSDSPSYRPSLGEQVSDRLRTAACLQEIGDLGLDDIQKITLVSTSESSFSSVSVSSMSRFQQYQPSQMDPQSRAQLQQEIQDEGSRLNRMHQEVLDMMDDYTADDVNQGNADRVDGRLKEIADARADFRSAVRRYKDLYGSYGDSDGRLDTYVTSLNLSVRAHANGIWSKVALVSPPMSQYERESLALQREQLQQHQQANPTPRQSWKKFKNVQTRTFVWCKMSSKLR